MRISGAVEKLKPYGAKTKQTLTIFVKKGMVPGGEDRGVLNIDDSFIEEAVAWRKGVLTRQEIILEETGKDADEDLLKKCVRYTADHTKDVEETDSAYAVLFTGFIPKDELGEQRIRQAVRKALALYHGKAELMPMAEVCRQLNLSRYVVGKALQRGDLEGEMRSGAWYVDPEAIRQHMDTLQSFKAVQETAREVAGETKTLYDPDSTRDRAVLYGFLRQSDVAGKLFTAGTLKIQEGPKNALYYPAAFDEELREKIAAYLRTWGKADKRREVLQKDPVWDKFPKTYDLLQDFAENKRAPAVTALMEVLVNGLKSEIFDCTDDDVLELSDLAASSLAATHGKVFSAFMGYVQRNCSNCAFKADFMYISEMDGKKRPVTISPYPFAQYIAAANLVFSEESIRKYRLTERALSDPKTAYIWFFMVMHYVAAWRVSDINRIRILKLPYGKEETERMIREGTYSKAAAQLSLILENEINSLKMLPDKTKGKQKRHFLVIRIPESLRDVFGLVYSIICLHAEEGKMQTFRLEYREYYAVFGQDYTDIFGQEPFGNRRANKSFLNALRDIVNSTEGSGKTVTGDLIASYARAHARRDGMMAQATEHYLETTMDGYDSDTVLRILFDSGACSFIPYMLMEAVYGTKFEILPFPAQTEVIRAFGHDAMETELAVMAVQKSFLTGKALVDTFIKRLPKGKAEGIAQDALLKIAFREARSKQVGVSCFLSAQGMKCTAITADDCIGCRYAIIHHGAAAYVLGKVRKAYEKLSEAVTEGENKKMVGLIEQNYLPAVYEVLKFAKEMYHEDISDYKKSLRALIEEGGKLT